MKLVLLIVLLVALLGCSPQGGVDVISSVDAADAPIYGDFLQRIETRIESTYDFDGVATAICGVGEIVVGGGCECSGGASDGLAGTLFACIPQRSSYAGACYSLWPDNVGTPIKVYAICMKGLSGRAITSSKPSVIDDAEENDSTDTILESLRERVNERKAIN